jgi:hypothetical protein
VKSRILSALVILAIAGTAFAGDAPSQKPEMKKAEMMQMMKAEMQKCAVCNNMAAHLDELMPVMKMEVVKLNNGMAMIHTITDPAKVAAFQAVCDDMNKAGATAVTMTDEEAKTKLCSSCQEMRNLVKAGAQMSMGKTQSGDIMMLTSSDPAVQAKIADFHTKCAMMMSQM